jgi:hypothetical protein
MWPVNLLDKYKTIVHKVFKVIKQVTNAILQVFRLLEIDERWVTSNIALQIYKLHGLFQICVKSIISSRFILCKYKCHALFKHISHVHDFHL